MEILLRLDGSCRRTFPRPPRLALPEATLLSGCRQGTQGPSLCACLLSMNLATREQSLGTSLQPKALSGELRGQVARRSLEML